MSAQKYVTTGCRLITAPIQSLLLCPTDFLIVRRPTIGLEIVIEDPVKHGRKVQVGDAASYPKCLATRVFLAFGSAVRVAGISSLSCVG